MTTETAKKKGTPQILKTDTALKLAEKWVANMRSLQRTILLRLNKKFDHTGLDLVLKCHGKQSVDPQTTLSIKNYRPSLMLEEENTRSVAESAGDDSEDDDESELVMYYTLK